MCIQPAEKKDGGMVVDVQEGKLTPFLPENNKYGVPKIPNFGNVKEPLEIGERRIFKVAIIARPKCVVVAISKKTGFNGHVSTQHNLGKVVDKHERVRVNCGDSFESKESSSSDIVPQQK
jgi:hypothetical protein